jgi:hypothetical protein
MHRARTNLLFLSPDLSQRFATRFKVNNLLRHNFVRDLFRVRLLEASKLIRACCFFDEYHRSRLPFPCGIRAVRRRPWFFSFRLGPAVPGCPAVRSALLRPETTVAEMVEFLRLSGPGQGLREPS